MEAELLYVVRWESDKETKRKGYDTMTDNEMTIKEQTGRRLGNWSSWVSKGFVQDGNEEHSSAQGLVDKLQNAYDTNNEGQMKFWLPIVEAAFHECQYDGADRIMSRAIPLDPVVDRTAGEVEARIAALYTEFATDNPEVLRFSKVSGQGLVHDAESFGAKKGADASKLQKDGYRTFVKASKSPEDMVGGNYYITSGKNGNKTIEINGLTVLDLTYVPKTTTEGGEA